MKKRAKILPVGCILVGLSFASYFASAHAVASDQLGRIIVGMSENQVKSLLGVPQFIRRRGASGTAFYYGGLARLMWCSVEISFDADGQVEGKVFHDH